MEDESFAREESKKLLLSWIDIETEFNPASSDRLFGYLDVSIDGHVYSRPLYLTFTAKSLFIDAPVCEMDQVENLAAELGAMGIGKMGVAMTYHNVLNYSQIIANPEASKLLLEMIVSQAGKREFEILGTRHFLKKEELTQGSASSVESNHSIQVEPVSRTLDTASKQGETITSDEQEPSAENSTWYRQNLVLVDANADAWFELFVPKPASEVHQHRLSAMGDVAGRLSHVAAQDLKMVSKFEIDEAEQGDIQSIPETAIGKEFLRALESEELKASYKTTWAASHESQIEVDNKHRLQGQWVTAAGTPFYQSLEVHINKEGQETAYWFVDLLATTVPIDGVDYFEVEDEDGKISTINLDTKAGGFSLGQLSTKLQLPVFMKQLAFMCETPLPGSQLMTLSRDLAFPQIPHEARPVPFFTIKNHAEASGFSRINGSQGAGSSNVFESTIFPQVVQFGWKLTQDSLPFLSQILPLLVNGCTAAATTVEDGYVNFRDPNFTAPWDDALGNPCAKLVEGASRSSRVAAPQWIPVTQVGGLMDQTRQLLVEVGEFLNVENDVGAREKLVQLVRDGAGPFLVHGINTYIYRFLIPELSQNPELIREIEYFAHQAVDQRMLNQSTNALSNLGVAYYILGELDSSSKAFTSALAREDKFSDREASFFMSLIEKGRGNLELSKSFQERCVLAGGYQLGPGLLGTPANKTTTHQTNQFLEENNLDADFLAGPSEVSETLSFGRVFPAIPENSILRQLVSNFGVKLKLAQNLSTATFEGGKESTDSYYVMLKISLLIAALEAWERLSGKGTVIVNDGDLSKSLASEPSWKHFREKLISLATSPQLRGSVQRFYDGDHQNLVPLLTTIRHGFFHPGLTATNSTLISRPKLREALLDCFTRVEAHLLEAFDQWSIKMLRWHELEEIGDDDLIETAKTLGIAAGYPREAIEIEFRKHLTDNEWAILIAELWCEDEFDVEETIADVISNMASYATEHEWWDTKAKSIRGDSEEA
ncbi:hypothetical protein [Candidatus Aquiluna sp. UB-MaderosW2red]|uniref:hypothetical protein n=1 Tax=Candidatus Aquiluna sp. UB-MaderosW2red TaxID=1855377 RepID=UPI000875E844|nr:hypothetical protein [Candidatus Aquiluna sp. UB-MaderosW2red]SCX03441.1 hypothetical protein SAMN05216534_0122 [Candidatus Aquiluna sp. UB-MaderosW2red]